MHKRPVCLVIAIFVSVARVVIRIIQYNYFISNRWLDKLGISARDSVPVVIRQDLYGHNYGLLDANMNPNPVGDKNQMHRLSST